MAQRNRKNSIIIYRKKRQENNEMNDLDKVYAESVAKEYMPKETNKVRQLKKLDERAKLPAFVTAMTLGIIGILIFGTGMCFGLGVFGTGAVHMVIGILLGIAGAAICIVNYPLYKGLLKKGKKYCRMMAVFFAKYLFRTRK